MIVGRSADAHKGLRPRILWSAIAVFMLIPAVAMRFTSEVNWSALDFAAAAFLLAATGLVYQFAVRRIRSRALRIIGAAALSAALLLIWAQGSVGFF